MQSGAAFGPAADGGDLGLLFTIPSTGAGVNWQYQYRAYPTPPFDLTVCLDVDHESVSNSGWSACGIVVSDGTKVISLGPQYGNAAVGAASTGWNVWGAKYTNATTYSATYGDWPVSRFGALPSWYQWSDDNTNITLKCSMNGNRWVTIGSEPRTTFLTPTRIGLGGSNFAGNDLLMCLRSWEGVA
jgi:hypothetical protein